MDGFARDPRRPQGLRLDDRHPRRRYSHPRRRVFCFTLCWNEFSYALTFLSSTQNKTVPVAIVNEFVAGDIYRWGSLMAGALVGSLPLVVLYVFFVEHYVSAMTGVVKE